MKKIIFLLIIISAALFAQQKRTHLMDALEKRDIKTAIALINSGVDINTKDRMGETPLIEAAEEGLTEVVKVLIEKKANLNAANVRNRTALSRASYKGHTEIVLMLVDAGADRSIKSEGIKILFLY